MLKLFGNFILHIFLELFWNTFLSTLLWTFLRERNSFGHYYRYFKKCWNFFVHFLKHSILHFSLTFSILFKALIWQLFWGGKAPSFLNRWILYLLQSSFHIDSWLMSPRLKILPTQIGSSKSAICSIFAKRKKYCNIVRTCNVVTGVGGNSRPESRE